MRHRHDHHDGEWPHSCRSRTILSLLILIRLRTVNNLRSVEQSTGSILFTVVEMMWPWRLSSLRQRLCVCVFLVVHAAHRCSCTLDEDVAEMAEHGAGGHSPSFDGRPHVHGASMHEPEPGPGLYYLGEKHDVHSRTNMRS